MATGEKKWSTEGKSVKRISFEPIPPGEYRIKVKRSWEVRKSESEKSSQLRYASGYFEVLGTAKEGGKNRRQYHSFYVDLSPGSDGEVMPNRNAQLTEFGKAVDEKFVLDIIQQQKRLKDGTYKKVDTLNPKQLVEQLNNLDGTELSARLKVEKNLKGELDNVIDFFVEAEPSESEDEESDGEELGEDETSDDEAEESDESDESDEEADESEESDDSDDSNEDGDEDEDESDDDDLPPRDTSKGKVKQGPPAKGGKKAVAKKKGKK